MIKIKDLRIGNYVKHKKYPITYKVTAIGENGGWMQVTDEFEDIDSAIEKLEPIPLTEDWLVKCPNDFIYPNWIKFVHDLQNWYYYNNNKKELVLK